MGQQYAIISNTGQPCYIGSSVTGTGAIFAPYLAATAPVTTSMGVSHSNHVVANGGTATGATTQTAISVFWQRLVNVGLSPLFYCINVFTESIVASATPITSSTNAWLWTNNSFAATDLDKNGLYASSSAKYFDTTMTFAGIGASLNSIGYSEYLFSADTGASYNNDFGIWSSGGTNPRFGMQIASGSTSYLDCWSVTNGRISGQSSGSGFVSYNRTSATTAAWYFFNSTYTSGSQQTVASSTSLTTDSLPTGNIYAYRMNGDGNNRNTNKMSFMALHQGLALSQSAQLYLAVQQLRTDLGGGYR